MAMSSSYAALTFQKMSVADDSIYAVIGTSTRHGITYMEDVKSGRL